MQRLLSALLLLVAACGSAAPAPDTGDTGDSGDSGAPLTLVDMDGGEHDVDAMLASGTPVALVFWSTW